MNSLFGTHSKIIHSLEKALENNKPGLAAQLNMSPDPRPGTKVVYEMMEVE